jgi:protein SCO1/2
MSMPTRIRRPSTVFAFAAIVALARPAAAQILEDAPKELEGVGIVERLGAQVPLDLAFRDESGADLTLARFFEPGRPVLLNIVYFDCPMLCNVFLDGFVSGLRELDWTPGREFEIVTVSMDPRDDAAGATRKRAHYVERLGRPEAAAGWHFLTGDEAGIARLAEAVGFRYRFMPDRGEFAHSAGLFVATPDGRLSRVITGVVFEPQTLRLALVEASHGKIGSPVDHFLLFCFAYDHTAGRYGPTAFKIMRLGGALTVLAMAFFLLMNWRLDARRRRSAVLGAGS